MNKSQACPAGASVELLFPRVFSCIGSLLTLALVEQAWITHFSSQEDMPQDNVLFDFSQSRKLPSSTEILPKTPIACVPPTFEVLKY